nr:hypothetical transcript [Hymenolepis microstoma]
MGSTPLAFGRAFRLPNMDFHSKAFFSIQLEKSICRDRVMNAYAKKMQGMTKSKSGSSNESEKLKRGLIVQFCGDYSKRTQQAALRAQIIALYASFLKILKIVPNIREFFTIGKMLEKKGQDNDAEMAKSDPRELYKRVLRILSMDDKRFYNLWFIPHFIEVLFAFCQLDDDEATRDLRSMCHVAGALHDIIKYPAAFALLGINSSKTSTEQREQFYFMAIKANRMQKKIIERI